MARILVSAFSNLGLAPERLHDTFVLSFMKALERTGNQVLAVRCNDFIKREYAPLRGYINKSSLLKAVDDFAPELIITFNNMFPCAEFITRTNCPIFIYPADGYDFFNFRSLIDQRLERYRFLYVNDDNYNTYAENIADLKKDGQMCPFSYATDFRARSIDQDLPLSFLGSLPNYAPQLAEYFTRWPYARAEAGNEIKRRFIEELDRFKDAPYSKFACELPGFYQEYPDAPSMETIGVFLITTKLRFEILSGLTDLNLSISGFNSFCQALTYNYNILRAYDFEKCVTFDQVETLYNRSKIALNLPNARATKGCSWRVPDIMATNSVLLSSFSSDVAELMRGYAELPMYASVAEARTLAEKLLKDDLWRRELSEASRQMIEDKCRFEPNFKIMAEMSGVELCVDGPGSFYELIPAVQKLKLIPAVQKLKLIPAVQKLKRGALKMLPYFMAKKFFEPR